jgi:D-alanyl-lipoteichoic acid acyltransferase DltB (MBOAT superfamily)
MAFGSFLFFVFVGLVAGIYYLVPAGRRNLVLLIANYIFYTSFDYRFSFVLFALTSTTFFIGNKIRDATREDNKWKLLVLSLVTNLSVLAFFKYASFFVNSGADLLGLFGLPQTSHSANILLPLGISFYVFQTLTYVLDIYYGNLEHEYTFAEFAVFASFFPAVVAGPILRASQFLPQLRRRRERDFKSIEYGIYLIVMGLFRKVLIGDACGRIVDQIFADPQYFASLEILSAILLYALQIYNDFAGYSSIARGVARLMGFDIYVNFRQPYFAKNVSDFWRRWHISLSSWLRDYLFAPLQLRFRSHKAWGNVSALLITFTLCGLWHGASWTFIFWGFLHGVYMSFAVLLAPQKKRWQSLVPNQRLLHCFQTLFTFVLVTMTWVFFRGSSLGSISMMFGGLMPFTLGTFPTRFVGIVLSFYGVSFFLDYFEEYWNSDTVLLKLSPEVSYGIVIVVMAVVFSYMFVADSRAPFIYAQF